MKIKSKKIVAVLMLLLTIFSSFSNIAFATTEISSAELHDGGECGRHLQYWHNNRWYFIITTFVTHEENGIEYPAYCLNRDVPRSW